MALLKLYGYYLVTRLHYCKFFFNNILGKTLGTENNLRFVSGSQDQTLLVYDYEFENNKVTCAWIGKGHERSVECVCSNDDGTRLASGSFDHFVKIWNTGIYNFIELITLYKLEDSYFSF